MITAIRNLINSRWGVVIAIAFVGLIGVAFALGDVTGSGSFGGLGGANVAKVGDQDVSLGELDQALDNRLEAERKDNPTLDMAKFVESGGYDSTLNALLNRYALATYGADNGIAVSKRLVDSEILQFPGVKGVDGKFSRPAFEGFLRQMGLTEKMVRDDLTQNFYARQMLGIAGKAGKAPESLVLPYASLLLEKRSGQVGVVPAAAFVPTTPPSETVLAQFYKTNASRYTIPEKRSVSYAIFDASVVNAKAEPTEKDIADYYKTNAAQYAATETRDFTQVVFPTEAAAKAAADRITAGENIGAVASAVGLSASTKSGMTRDALTKETTKAVADAIFAASANGVSRPAKGAVGWHLARVSAVKQLGAKPLAAVRDEISKTIAGEKRGELLAALTTEIESEFDSGATIADMAKAQGLTVETTPMLFATGQNPDNPAYKPIPEMARILPAAFDLETDSSAQLIEIVPGEKFAMIAVAEAVEAAPAPLKEIRDVVAKQWALAEGDKKAKAVAEQVRKAIAGGKSLNEALAATGVRLPAPETVSGTRGQMSTGQQIPPPLMMLFAMKKGTAKTLSAGGDRGWFIVQLNEVIKGDASKETEMLAARRQEMEGLLAQEYIAQMINAAAKESGVTRNEELIARRKKELTTRGTNGQ